MVSTRLTLQDLISVGPTWLVHRRHTFICKPDTKAKKIKANRTIVTTQEAARKAAAPSTVHHIRKLT